MGETPAPHQFAMGPSSWVGLDAYLLLVPPESQKVVHCRCFAWPRLPRLIPPRSITAADLNVPAFQEQRAAGWCKAIDSPRRDDQCAPPGSLVRCAAFASKSPLRAEPAAGVMQSTATAPTTRTRSALVTTVIGRTGPCAAANQAWRVRRRQSAVSRQPGGQGFQLLHC